MRHQQAPNFLAAAPTSCGPQKPDHLRHEEPALFPPHARSVHQHHRTRRRTGGHSEGARQVQAIEGVNSGAWCSRAAWRLQLIGCNPLSQPEHRRQDHERDAGAPVEMQPYEFALQTGRPSATSHQGGRARFVLTGHRHLGKSRPQERLPPAVCQNVPEALGQLPAPGLITAKTDPWSSFDSQPSTDSAISVNDCVTSGDDARSDVVHTVLPWSAVIKKDHNEAAGRTYGAWLGADRILDGDLFFVRIVP